MKLHVLVVCSGNRERSPLAMSLMTRGLTAELTPKVEVRTGGIRTLGDSEMARTLAGRKGLEFTKRHPALRNRNPVSVDQPLVDWADLILVMRSSHAEAIKRRFQISVHKLQLLLGDAELWLDANDYPEPPALPYARTARLIEDKMDDILSRLSQALERKTRAETKE
jgi:protein-tyrosine-phosphatase